MFSSHRLLLKLVLGALLGAFLFFGINENGLGTAIVLGDDNTPGSTNAVLTSVSTQDQVYNGIISVLEPILEFLYIILRPLLVIAGKAMDNSLIYGGVFHLDVALRQFRNIVKNFANFTLGFLVLYSVLMNFFGQAGKNSPKEIIRKTFIAGVLIQLSWFMIGAVLDISTIATYGIGGMPLTILKGTEYAKKPLVGVYTRINLSEVSTQLGIPKYTVYHRYGNENIGPCLIKKAVYTTGSAAGVSTGGSYLATIDEQKAYFSGAFGTAVKMSETYCMYGSTPIVMTVGNTPDERAFTLKNMNDRTSKAATDLQNAPGQKLTLGSLFDNANSFVGPFYGLYSSLLNLGTLNVTTAGANDSKYAMEFLIKAIVAIALIVPLFVLAIGMIIRVGVLRLVIAFSPFLIILRVFDFKIDIGGKDNTKLNNIIGLIFMPVYATFALSVSMIFLSAIQTSSLDVFNKNSGTSPSSFEQSFGIQQRIDDKSNKNSTDYCFSSTDFPSEQCIRMPAKAGGFDIFLNFFSRLITNLFAIGLMRMVVFAALSASSITKGLADTASKLAKGLLDSVPFIPVGGGAMNLKNLRELPDTAFRNIEQKISEPSRESLKNIEDILGIQKRDTQTYFGEKVEKAANEGVSWTQADLSKNVQDALNRLNPDEMKKILGNTDLNASNAATQIVVNQQIINKLGEENINKAIGNLEDKEKETVKNQLKTELKKQGNATTDKAGLENLVSKYNLGIFEPKDREQIAKDLENKTVQYNGKTYSVAFDGANLKVEEKKSTQNTTPSGSTTNPTTNGPAGGPNSVAPSNKTFLGGGSPIQPQVGIIKPTSGEAEKIKNSKVDEIKNLKTLSQIQNKFTESQIASLDVEQKNAFTAEQIYNLYGNKGYRDALASANPDQTNPENALTKDQVINLDGNSIKQLTPSQIRSIDKADFNNLLNKEAVVKELSPTQIAAMTLEQKQELAKSDYIVGINTTYKNGTQETLSNFISDLISIDQSESKPQPKQ